MPRETMTCPDCGATIKYPAPNQKRCSDCQKKHKRALNTAYSRKLRKGEVTVKLPVDKPCAWCGEIMHGVGSNRRFCDACRNGKLEGKKEQRREKERVHRKNEKLKKRDSMASISEKARIAKERGIHYGDLVAEQYEEAHYGGR